MCMTSSRDALAKQVLNEFLEGRMSLPELQAALHDQLILDFDSAPGRREIAKSDLETENVRVTVTKDHVRQMLLKYLHGEVSALDLSNWAALVFMLPVFAPEGETEDERWEAGSGPTWTILQELATPELFGNLALNVVHKYLKSLARKSGGRDKK
mgnify:CR=1 FL=1